MKRYLGWAGLALLIALALVLGLTGNEEIAAHSKVPSVDNAGPEGAKVLFTYLREAGFDVRRVDEKSDVTVNGLRTWVFAASGTSTLSAEERSRIEAFVNAGGDALLFSPGAVRTFFDDEQVRRGARPRAASFELDGAEDPAGVNAQSWAPAGPMAAAKALRVANEPSVVVHTKGAVPIAGVDEAVIAWWLPRGRGAFWVFAGPDLVQNKRLELEDNLVFWQAIAARGPIAFDERRTKEDPPSLSWGLWAVLAQLLVCFALFALARGTRLGPPRPERAVVHRSVTEYLHAFAWLMRRAKVERELARDLRERLRRLFHERAGVLLSLSDEDAARELETHARIPAPRTLSVLRELRALETAERVQPAQYAAAAREAAAIERVLRGLDDA